MAQQHEARFVQEAEADPRALEGKRVAVLGYGNLGRRALRHFSPY